MERQYRPGRRGLLAMMDADDTQRGLLALFDRESDGPASSDDWIDRHAVARRAAGDAAVDLPLIEPDGQISLIGASPYSGGLGLVQPSTKDLLRQLLTYLPDAPVRSPEQGVLEDASRGGPDSEPGRTPFRYLDRGRVERPQPSAIEHYLAGSLRWLGVEPRRWLTGQNSRRPERPAVVTGPRG